MTTTPLVTATAEVVTIALPTPTIAEATSSATSFEAPVIAALLTASVALMIGVANIAVNVILSRRLSRESRSDSRQLAHAQAQLDITKTQIAKELDAVGAGISTLQVVKSAISRLLDAGEGEDFKDASASLKTAVGRLESSFLNYVAVMTESQRKPFHEAKNISDKMLRTIPLITNQTQLLDYLSETREEINERQTQLRLERDELFTEIVAGLSRLKADS